jgi:hypothetical protein
VGRVFLQKSSNPSQSRFDAVLVSKLDRWGRSVADSVRSIQELAALGVRFVAITQNIDTDEANRYRVLRFPSLSAADTTSLDGPQPAAHDDDRSISPQSSKA